jgi:formylglycine-generating enzyme required for sulfatase activity
MACVPGGPFWRGSDHHGKNARPRQRIVVSTFYLDIHEVTTPEFVACVKAGLCRPPKAYLRHRGFHGKRQPAVPVSWKNALRICLMQGKRLPTEAEWEKAARTPDGRTFPWGEAAPTCRRAWYRGCKPATTRPVGSLPPNPYGIYDLAGNGYEWVMDWYSPCWAGCPGACGAACAGPDPRGPCAGVLRCKGHRRRVLRGGSWYWSASHLRTFWRRPEYPKSGNHRLSARCATRSANPTPRPPAEVRRLLKRLEQKPLPR